MEFREFDDLPLRSEINDIDEALLSGADFDGRMAIAHLLGKELRQVRDSSGTGILKRSVLGYGSEAVTAQPNFVPRRQCILSGLQDNLGQSAFLEANGFNVSLLASKASPFLAALADGFDANGMPIDYLVGFDHSQINTWTVSQGTSYLLIVRDSSGAISFSATPHPPRYEDARSPNQYSLTNAFVGGTPFASSTESGQSPNNPFAFGGEVDSGGPADGINPVWRAANTPEDGSWLAYDFGAGNEKVIRLLRYRHWQSYPHPIVAYEVSNDGTNWTEITKLYDTFFADLTVRNSPTYPYFYIPNHAPARYCRFRAIGSPGNIAYEIRGLLGFEADYQQFELNFSTREFKWQFYDSEWADSLSTIICVGEVIADANGIVAIYPWAIGGRNLIEVRCLDSRTYRDYTVNHNLGCVPNLVFPQFQFDYERNYDTAINTAGHDDWGDIRWGRGETGLHFDKDSWRSWGADIRSIDRRQISIRSGYNGAILLRHLTSWRIGNIVGRFRFFVDRGW